MVIIFAIFLATVVTKSQGKYIELLSHEDFQDKPARRAGGGDNNSEESRLYIGNRDDKSYIPDIDLALTDIYLSSYTGVRRENSVDNANLNETTLPLHESSETIDDNNKNLKEGEKVDQDKNTPDSETPIQNSKEEPNVSPENNTLESETPIRVSDSEQSDTENIVEENTISPSTSSTENSVMRSTFETNSNNKSTNDIGALAPEFESEVHVPENEFTVNNTELSSKTTDPYVHDSSDVTLTDESTTDSVIDTTTTKIADIFNILDNQVFTTTIQNIEEVNTVATEDYSAVTEITSTNEYPGTIIESTTWALTLPPTIEKEHSTKNPEKITDTVINAINEIENITKSERCLYCYRVYEILFPTKRENQLFLRSQEPVKDQANFIRVNKYSQNFAYYMNKNRLGPNELEVDTRQNRKRNNELYDTAEASELLKEFNNESRKFIVFKGKNERPKTSDALAIRFKRQGNNRKKSKKKKSVRLFDDTNNDILPDLMHAMLGTESVDVPIIDTYKDLVDMKKHASLDNLDNLFDFVSVRDERARFVDMTRIRKRLDAVSTIDIYMNVLRDLIQDDSKTLKQYDWLATTVQIQSALTKILKLINHIRQSDPIHPADLQILKYVVFLYNFSVGVKEDNKFLKKIRKSMRLLSINKKTSKNKLMIKKRLINRIGVFKRTLLPYLVEEDEFSHLYEFFIDVQDKLFGLHEAIRHIAEVTKFDRQNWYGNLKQLYLSADEKHPRELLLHISMSRLVDLVEHSCKQGLHNDVIQYLQTHEEEAKRIVEEMLFIDKIVDDLEINIK